MPALSRFLGLLCILACAIGLRAGDITSFDMSPDEGNYLQAAWTLRLDGERPIADWIAEDREWLEHESTYPHSFVHQWVVRQLKRLGFGFVESVRLPSALLGSLTVLLSWLLLRARPWSNPRAALFAAGFVAFCPALAWYSRTGWGQTGCTLFWLGYFGFAARAFLAEEHSRAWVNATAMALFGLMAWGYHEMISIHVACMGLFTLFTFFRAEPRAVGRVLLERKGLYLSLLLGALPVVILTLRLFGQDFAEDLWLNAARPEQGGYFEQKWRIAQDLFGRSSLVMQTNLAILILAGFGFVALARRSPMACFFVTVQWVASALIFFFGFQDAQLVRIYLPNIVLLCLLAGFGADALWLHFQSKAKAPRIAAATALVACFLWPGLVSAQTIFADEEAPFAETSFYFFRGKPTRDNLGPIGDYIREHRGPGELLGVSDDYAPLFRLRDMGIPARMHAAPVHWKRPPKELPKYILAIRRHMKKKQRIVETGGPYVERARSRNNRFGLFENTALLPE